MTDSNEFIVVGIAGTDACSDAANWADDEACSSARPAIR